MRVFLRYFVVVMAIGLMGGSVLCAAVAWAAGTAAPGSTIVGETTLFTWQFVVLMGTNLVTGALFYAGVRAHIANTDIHRGYKVLTDDFPTQTECDLRHGLGKHGHSE